MSTRAAWLIMLGLALGLAEASAQDAAVPHLERVRLHATVPASDVPVQVQVQLDYVVTLLDTARTIPLRGLAFFDTVPAAVSAYADTLALPLRIDAADAPLLTGTLEVPASVPRSTPFAFTVAYTLPHLPQTGAFDLTLPVLFVDWLPREATQDFFVGEVALPASHTLAESFPTAPTLEREADGGRRYRFSLQVVPSLVRLRGYIGRAPLLTTARVIDLGVLAALLLIAFVSWHRFRRPSTKP